jgi:RNA polymerase subunit RPABC4/transcription elongation factor Spt4
MSKAHRGKGIRELAAHGRGTCPVCGASGIKVLYEAGEQKVKVCKPCKAAIKHGKKSAPTPVQAAPAAE